MAGNKDAKRAKKSLGVYTSILAVEGCFNVVGQGSQEKKVCKRAWKVLLKKKVMNSENKCFPSSAFILSCHVKIDLVNADDCVVGIYFHLVLCSTIGIIMYTIDMSSRPGHRHETPKRRKTPVNV